MHRLRQIVSGLAVGAMVLGSTLVASAQSTPATMMSDQRAQLAAITPATEDLPTGFQFVGETFLDAGQVAATGVDANTLAENGFYAQYVSVYENPETGERIRAYVSMWNDDEAARQGFALLEDEAVTNPNDELADSAAEAGEDPRETTTGTYTAADGTVVGTVDVTFRRGLFVVGVAHEKLDGSAAEPAIASGLATRADQRAQAVLNGEAIPHVNMALAGQVVSFAGDGNAVTQAGFLGPVEVESIYGVQGSLLSGVDSAWVESTMIGATDGSAPTITIGVSSFTNPDDARLVVEQAGDLFEPLQDQEAVDGVAVEGADAVSAFRYSTGEGSLNSYRLLYAIDGTLTVIDVQRAAGENGAEEAATAIAPAQATCQSGAGCQAPELPGSFTGQ